MVSFLLLLPTKCIINSVVLSLQAFGLIGGIITAVQWSALLSFNFWSTLIVSGGILLLNLLNAYQALHAKFSFLVKVVSEPCELLFEL